MKIKASKILNKTDLGQSGSHGGLVVYKNDENILIDFFEASNTDQTFIDKIDGEEMLIRYADYSRNGSTPNDRITPIGRYASKYDLQPGDIISLEKQIDGEIKRYIIEYAKQLKSVIFSGKSNKNVEVTNIRRFDEIIKDNIPGGTITTTASGGMEMVVKYDGINGCLTLNNDGDQFEICFNGQNIEAYGKYFELDTRVNPFELKQVSTWNYYIHSDEEEDAENEKADAELISSITTQDLLEIEDNYIPIPETKREPKIVNGKKIYDRNKKNAIQALKRANFSCQFDSEHQSFFRKRSQIKYMEPHHLIPLQYSDKFAKSLDVEANIISLCSECHNKIHYGEGAERLLSVLWEVQEDKIRKAGIGVMENGVEVDLTLLLKLYKIK